MWVEIFVLLFVFLILFIVLYALVYFDIWGAISKGFADIIKSIGDIFMLNKVFTSVFYR